MRLLNNVTGRTGVLLLTTVLAACSVFGENGDAPVSASDDPVVMSAPRSGPAADFPIVLGDPFTIDGVEYTPADTWNYDEVGFAAAASDGAGVTAAHRTLPLPSYIEVTSLQSGKTILARVERRGPMTGSNLLALSPEARAQLGASVKEPVRVRRVNPPEVDRAALRAGDKAPLRMETPQSLVTVLRRKLPATGSVSLGQMTADETRPAASAEGSDTDVTTVKPANTAIATEANGGFEEAFKEDSKEQTDYALPAIEPAAEVKSDTIPSSPDQQAATSAPRGSPVVPSAGDEAERPFAVQAATFASQSNAARAAASLGGFVEPSGRYFRVRTGPFATRGQAEAALAKVRAAGYSDARIITTQ